MLFHQTGLSVLDLFIFSLKILKFAGFMLLWTTELWNPNSFIKQNFHSLYISSSIMGKDFWFPAGSRQEGKDHQLHWCPLLVNPLLVLLFESQQCLNALIKNVIHVCLCTHIWITGNSFDQMPDWASKRRVEVWEAVVRTTERDIVKRDMMKSLVLLWKNSHCEKVAFVFFFFFLFCHWLCSTPLKFPPFLQCPLVLFFVHLILMVPPVVNGTRTDWRDYKAELLPFFLLLMISAPGRWPNCQNQRKLMRIIAMELARWLSVRYMAYKNTQCIGIVNIIGA